MVDGWIDHLTVFISGGIDAAIQSRLDRVTRIWRSVTPFLAAGHLKFPKAFQGPLAVGYGSHFGLGMFGAR